MGTIKLPLPMDETALALRLAPVAAYFNAEARFLVKYLAACIELQRRGVPFKIGELKRRSSAYQAALYAQGRTKPGKIVTWAKPGSSYHERGKAGHIEVAREYREVLGQVAELAGLTWGGRWVEKFPPDGDWQHVEDRS